MRRCSALPIGFISKKKKGFISIGGGSSSTTTGRSLGCTLFFLSFFVFWQLYHMDWLLSDMCRLISYPSITATASTKQ
jgi:hypothetical protein